MARKDEVQGRRSEPPRGEANEKPVRRPPHREPTLKQPAEVPMPAGEGDVEFARLMQVSPDLAHVVGSTELSQGEATRKLWEYIYSNNLLHKNEGTIHTDDVLKAVFGGRTIVSVDEIEKEVRKHLR